MLFTDSKKCPKCKKRFDFETYRGANSWTEYFGPELGACPFCHHIYKTGKFAKWERAATLEKVFVIGQVITEMIVITLLGGVLVLVPCATVIDFSDMSHMVVFVLFIVLWLYLMKNVIQNTIADVIAINEEKFITLDDEESFTQDIHHP